MWLALMLMVAMPTSSDIQTIAQGGMSGIERPRHVVVRTEDEWSALWREHAGDGDRPAVDFGSRMVVGVFLGTRMTAGYSVTITRVEPGGADLTVWYRESTPAPDALTAQVLTMPFHLVSVPRVEGRVTFSTEGDVAR